MDSNILIDITEDDADEELVKIVKKKVENVEGHNADPQHQQLHQQHSDVKALLHELWPQCQIGEGEKIRRLVKSVTIDHERKHLLEARGDDRWLHDTPLLRAARCGKKDAVLAFLELGSDINAHNKVGNNALHLAAGYGHLAVMKLLVDMAGMDIEGKGQWNRTALHHAASENYPIIVKYLLSKKADLEAKGGHFERTPLGMAAHFGRTEIVNILCEAGARINAPDADGETPLHLAATTGKTETGRELIDKWHANIDAVDNENWSPLMTAAAENHPSFIQMLLECGARINIVTSSEGHSALHIAAEFNRRNVIETILNFVRDRDTGMGEVKAEERLMNMVNKRDETPLHVACSHGSFLAVQILVERGANLSMKNDKAETPMTIAKDVALGARGPEFMTQGEQIVQLLKQKNAPEN